MAIQQPYSPPPIVIRHPLGLPPGSVRATLVIMVIGLFLTLLLLPEEKTVVVPLYLYFLLGLVLLFFASHGGTIAPEGTAQPSPWWLPRGTFRTLIVLATAGVVGWLYHKDPDLLLHRLTPEAGQLQQWPSLLLALAGGFVAGWIIRLGSWRNSPLFQDLQAWVSLLAMLALGAEILIRLFIRPTLEQDLNLPLWEVILVAVVALYFGVRS